MSAHGRYASAPWLKAALLISLSFPAMGWGARSEQVKVKVLARSMAPVALGSGPVVADLVPVGRPLAAQLDSMPRGHRLYLVVRGLTAEAPPGTLFSAFLDLPTGTHPGRDDPRRVGVIGFYSARRPGAANAPDAESPVNADAEKMFFSFDVTETARALRSRGLLGARTTITLIPNSAPDPAAQARIGRLELVEQ
jgi:hypothetical protein